MNIEFVNLNGVVINGYNGKIIDESLVIPMSKVTEYLSLVSMGCFNGDNGMENFFGKDNVFYCRLDKVSKCVITKNLNNELMIYSESKNDFLKIENGDVVTNDFELMASVSKDMDIIEEMLKGEPVEVWECFLNLLKKQLQGNQG